MALSELLKRIGESLRAGHYANEESIRAQVVVATLGALGWDTTDPQLLRPEYSIRKGRADVALFTDDFAEAPNVVIEVKGPDKSIDDDAPVKQLLNYCYELGTQIALLTNGKQWNFHLPCEAGNVSKNRLVQSIDLVNDQERLASILERYLAFERQRSGEAAEDARKDYKGLANKKQVEKNLPKVWSAMLAGPLDSLVRLVAEQYESIHGNQPDYELIEEHLKSFGPSRSPSIIREAPATPSRTVQRKARSGGVFWRVGSASGSEEQAVTAFVKLFEALYDSVGDENFAKLAEATKSRKTRLLARNRLGLHISRDINAHSIKESQQLRNGWWLDIHFSNEGKQRKIEQAQEKLKSELGIKLRLEFRVK